VEEVHSGLVSKWIRRHAAHKKTVWLQHSIRVSQRSSKGRIERTYAVKINWIKLNIIAFTKVEREDNPMMRTMKRIRTTMNISGNNLAFEVALSPPKNSLKLHCFFKERFMFAFIICCRQSIKNENK
jgi:hypothetical protein